MPEIVGSNPTDCRKHFSAILIFKMNFNFNFNLHWRKSQFLIDSGVSTDCLIDSGWCLCGNQMLLNHKSFIILENKNNLSTS